MAEIVVPKHPKSYVYPTRGACLTRPRTGCMPRAALEAEREQHELVADRLRQALEEKEHTLRQVRAQALCLLLLSTRCQIRCQIARCGPVDAQQPSVCFCTAHAAAASTA